MFTSCDHRLGPGKWRVMFRNNNKLKLGLVWRNTVSDNVCITWSSGGKRSEWKFRFAYVGHWPAQRCMLTTTVQARTAFSKAFTPLPIEPLSDGYRFSFSRKKSNRNVKVTHMSYWNMNKTPGVLSTPSLFAFTLYCVSRGTTLYSPMYSLYIFRLTFYFRWRRTKQMEITSGWFQKKLKCRGESPAKLVRAFPTKPGHNLYVYISWKINSLPARLVGISYVSRTRY